VADGQARSRLVALIIAANRETYLEINRTERPGAHACATQLILYAPLDVSYGEHRGAAWLGSFNKSVTRLSADFFRFPYSPKQCLSLAGEDSPMANLLLSIMRRSSMGPNRRAAARRHRFGQEARPIFPFHGLNTSHHQVMWNRPPSRVRVPNVRLHTGYHTPVHGTSSPVLQVTEVSITYFGCGSGGLGNNCPLSRLM
jgi:hypothetical protein